MLGHLSQSLYSVGALVGGLGYVIGIVFILLSLVKLRAVGSMSQEGLTKPLLYFGAGVLLLFLPSTLTVITNSTFGTGNVLQYIQYNPYSGYNSMGILIQTAGLIWFVRGCTLVVQGGQPGAKEGSKGLAFILAGIVGVNFEYCYGVLSYIVSHLILYTNGGH